MHGKSERHGHHHADGVDAARTCLGRFASQEELGRRARVAAETLSRLEEYRGFLGDLEKTDSCPGLTNQLADRAFDAERHFRVLLAEGVRSVNDLRDSGLLYPLLAEFGDAAREKGGEGLRERMAAAKKEFSAAFPDISTRYFDEAVEMLAHRKIEVTRDLRADVLRIKAPNLAGGEATEMKVRLKPQAGDLGRISVAEFFGAGGQVGLQAHASVMLPFDCHHRPAGSRIFEKVRSVDPYNALLGGLAAGRESMYRHARKVSAFGHGESMVRVEDPVTIIVAVIIAVGVGLVIYGLATGDYGLAAFGAVLILGGILVLCCGFILIIGLAA